MLTIRPQKIVLYAALSILAPNAFPAPPIADIVGIKTGMSQREVVLVLQKHQPSMQIEVSTPSDTYAVRLLARQPANPPNTGMMREVIEVYFGPMTGRALFIKRDVFLLEKNDRVARHTALEELTKKYGRATTVVDWGGSSTREWIFDDKDRPKTGKHYCHAPKVEPLDSGNDGCGVGIRAVVGDVENDVAAVINTAVHDHRMIAEEVSRREQAETANRDRTIKESPKRMPKL